MSEQEQLQRRLDRERRARKEAEVIAEAKTRELFEANRTLQDLNERLEEEVRQRTLELSVARDQAVGANKAKSLFLANMGHELRTPLNAIIGIAEVLHEEAQEFGQDDLVEPLERISGAGQKLLHMLNQILDMSKIESGKMELQLEEVDVESLLEEVVTATRPLAQERRNEISLRFAEETGTIHTDRVKLRQVLSNLLNNACKFTEDGQINVELSLAPVGNGNGVRIAVKDTGIGMAEDQTSGLFQAFTQADASITRKHGGAGLGLAICQRLCQIMGGNIEVKSEPDVGSTFIVTLPDGR